MKLRNKEARILALDIETKPAKAYVWRMWDENIAPDQIIEDGGIICVGAKWIGEPDVFFLSEWRDGHLGMLKGIHELMEEADAVITYNGDRFDLPKLNGEFVLNGLPPLAPITSIDLIKAVKKFGFAMNRLAYVGPLLKIGKKIKHEGFNLWKGVMDGNEKAQARMQRYCIQDVRLLETLYSKIRPFIRNHPHLGTKTKATACGACGSSHVHSRGYRRTKSFLIQRLQCQTCGSWSDGTRKKVT